MLFDKDLLALLNLIMTRFQVTVGLIKKGPMDKIANQIDILQKSKFAKNLIIRMDLLIRGWTETEQIQKNPVDLKFYDQSS